MKTRNSDRNLKRIGHIPVLSKRAREAQARNGSKVFADPHLHRAVTNRLFSEYVASPRSLREWAVEFVKAYKHLMDGGPVSTMPAPSLDPDVVREIDAMVRGDDATVSDDME